MLLVTAQQSDLAQQRIQGRPIDTQYVRVSLLCPGQYGRQRSSTFPPTRLQDRQEMDQDVEKQLWREGTQTERDRLLAHHQHRHPQQPFRAQQPRHFAAPTAQLSP